MNCTFKVTLTPGRKKNIWAFCIFLFSYSTHLFLMLFSSTHRNFSVIHWLWSVFHCRVCCLLWIWLCIFQLVCLMCSDLRTSLRGKVQIRLIAEFSNHRHAIQPWNLLFSDVRYTNTEYDQVKSETSVQNNLMTDWDPSHHPFQWFPLYLIHSLREQMHFAAGRVKWKCGLCLHKKEKLFLKD